METKFTKINLDEWSRGELFRFYINKLPIVISLTVDIDVTPVLNYAKKKGLKFYPCMIWAVARVVNARDEFKYGFDEDGSLVRWDHIVPSYTNSNVASSQFASNS